MAFSQVFELSKPGSRGNAHGKITIQSAAWSGRVVKATGEENDKYFQFDVSGTGSYANTSYSLAAHGGYVGGSGGQIVGISLEHMGEVMEQSSGRYTVQFLGMKNTQGGSLDFCPAWGATVNDTDITLGQSLIFVEEFTRNETTLTNTGISNITLPYVFAGIRTLCDGDWYAVDCEITIDTDLPIFLTDDDLLDYCNSNGEDRSKIINSDEVDPEELYKQSKMVYYLHNIFTNYQSSGRKTTYWRNYRWKPGYGSKIRMYYKNPSDVSPYNLVLVVPGGLTRYKAPKGQYNDDDAFVEDEDTLQTHYLDESISFANFGVDKNIWEVSDFKTNIPRFADNQTATDYANDLVGIEAALNYNEILAYEKELPEPTFGNADAYTSVGYNGQTYFSGSCIYALTRQQMINFFTEIFKVQDPAFINAFKEGNVLFGDNQVNAILACMYFPFDVSDVCSLEGSAGDIWVGGWKASNAQGKKIQFNDKLLTIGEFQMTDMFKDVRDYSPYTHIYVQLPYCGTYELAIEKYLGKMVTIKYAVDIFSGACMALIFGNGILLDTMDGMIGAQRPITGRTAANIMSAISSGITGVAGGAAAGVKGGMVAAGAGNAIASGAIGEMAPAGVVSGLSAGTGTAALGTAVGLGGGLALGGAGALAGAAVGTFAAYNIKNAYADPPMQSRGSHGGNLGMFGVQQVHFIVAIRHHERPENELDLIGYPSGRSGLIGNFSGFLKSSCVYLADGFIGSKQERDEILQMLSKGIYI